MELQQIIIDFKKKTKMTNFQIAEKIGVAHTTVGRWVRGEVTNIQSETAEHLSTLLGVNVRALLDGEVISLTKPILGTVKAGYDLFLDNNYLGEETVCEEEYHKGDYFLKVVGNSMEPSGIVDGGLVYVKQCSIINSGSIAVVSVGDEVTVKKVMIGDDTITLIATNPNVEDRIYSYDDIEKLPIRILGKVLYSKNYM